MNLGGTIDGYKEAILRIENTFTFIEKKFLLTVCLINWILKWNLAAPFHINVIVLRVCV